MLLPEWKVHAALAVQRSRAEQNQMPWNGIILLSQSPSIKHHHFHRQQGYVLAWGHQSWPLAAWLFPVQCLEGGQGSLKPLDSTTETAEWNGAGTDQKQRGKICAAKVSAFVRQKLPHDI